MEGKEVDYSTIRIKNDLRKELDSLKVESESYSVVIANLIKENLQLKKAVEYLKEDKIQLYKLALKTEDSPALINNIHKSTYFINKVVEDVSSTEEEKLQELKTYLSEMIKEDPISVVHSSIFIKDMTSENTEKLLDNFVNYVINLPETEEIDVAEIENKIR